MRIKMTNEDEIMNTNSRQDTSNLNSSYMNGNHDGTGGSAANGEKPPVAPASSDSGAGEGTPAQAATQTNLSSNMGYLKNLAEAMEGHGVGRGNNSNSNTNFQASTSSGSGNSHANSSNYNNNDNDDASHVSNYHAGGGGGPGSRRISRDSLVSRDSLSDMLSADAVASNNIALMNSMLQQQQKQGSQSGTSGMGNNQSLGGIFNTGNNPALNQSLSQLMMNKNNDGVGSNNNNMNTMNQMSMLNSISGMLGSNNNNNTMGNTMNSMNNTSAAAAFLANNNTGGSSGQQQPQNSFVIPPKKRQAKHKQTFAQKLMHILSIKECHDAIRWMPNGCAFCIVDQKELIDKVLPKYFKEAKYTSFTRKLNRWGFKHFTLPTSEPSGDKEMSIYTHEQFLRDNPTLCHQMDGGHRRRSSLKDTSTSGGENPARGQVGRASTSSLASSFTSQSSGVGGIGGGIQDISQQLAQQSMMIQMQQLHQQQQNMMMQQMHQHQVMNQNPAASAMSQQGQQGSGGGMGQQGQGGSQQGANNQMMFDMSNFNSMQQGNNGGAKTGAGTDQHQGMMTNPFEASTTMGSGNNTGGGMNPIMESTSMGAAPMGMRRTSLGFMPYLPTSNRRDSVGFASAIMGRRDSGFSIGGLSTVSNDVGSAFPTGSTEGFRKLENESNDLAASFTSNQGSGEAKTADGSGAVNQDDIRHSQAKLAVLENMIEKERRKQTMLSSMEQNQPSEL